MPPNSIGCHASPTQNPLLCLGSYTVLTPEQEYSSLPMYNMHKKPLRGLCLLVNNEDYRYNSFLTCFTYICASDSARQEDHFQKRICPKRTFPSDFVKLVSEILYLFLAEKMFVCCLFVFCFVSCNFIRFWLTFF